MNALKMADFSGRVRILIIRERRICIRESLQGGLGKFSVNNYEPTTQQATAEYPFILTTGRMGHHYHSGTMTRRSWALDREHPNGFVEIHPWDAEKLGITARSKVRVSSEHGSLTCGVHITKNIVAGVVFIPFHFSEIPVNALIGENVDPVVQNT